MLRTRCFAQRTTAILAMGAFCLIPSSHALSQSIDRPTLLDRIDTIVQEAIQRDQIVGTSIGVMYKGEALVMKGYGYADLENEVRATEHTVYRIGSITKQFTALAIMQLVERGSLKLDDNLTKFLPDYPAKGYTVTLDRLLNHTSGIKGYTEIDKFKKMSRTDLSHQELINLFSSEPFEFPPGEKFQYNNSAYYLLGVIIEKASGMSYAEFLQKNVWYPLGMRETSYLENAPITKNRAEGYEIREGKVVNDDLLSMANPFSAGSLGSSVVDLFKWQAALNAHRLISKPGYEKMTTPGVLNDGKSTTYGYGFQLSNLDGHRKIDHGGAINGFRTQLSYYPDDELTVIVLCDTGSAHPAPLESRIARAVLGIPEISTKEVPLSEKGLQIYTGTYNPGRRPFTVALKDGALVLSGRALRPIGNNEFVFADDPYSKVSFAVTDGKATHLRLAREGHVTEAPRANNP